MFERLKRLYNEGRIHEAELQEAVRKGIITEEQMKEIVEGNVSQETSTEEPKEEEKTTTKKTSKEK